jgi:hypothetical protein
MREEDVVWRAICDECPAVNQFKLCEEMRAIRCETILNEILHLCVDSDESLVPLGLDSVVSPFDVYLMILGRRLERPLDQIMDHFGTFLAEMTEWAINDDDKVVPFIRMLSERCLDLPEYITPMALGVYERLGLLTVDLLETRNLDVIREVALFICYLSTLENFSPNREHVDLMVKIIIGSTPERHDRDIWMAAVTATHNVAITIDVLDIMSKEDMREVVNSIMEMNLTNIDIPFREANVYVLFDFAVACPDFSLIPELDKAVSEMVGSSLEFLLYVRSVLGEILSICDETMTLNGASEIR